jgi:DNA adenine methylase
MKTYAEPFAGGAALFFALSSDSTRTFERAILADQNAELIACYRAVKSDVRGLVEALRTLRHDRDTYYAVRAETTKGKSDVERGARLLYLNRTCFNGLWRTNASGQFNVPFGRYENPRIVNEEVLAAASVALSRAEIVCADFEVATESLSAGDFAYFDPPYVPTSKTASFTAYGPRGFGLEDQERLARVLQELRSRKVLAMLSNADTEGARSLYRDFVVETVRAPRAINSNANKRGDVSELLVTNWG